MPHYALDVPMNSSSHLTLFLGDKFETANESMTFMLTLFPELQESTNIIFREPSKKGQRRFRALHHAAPPLPREQWAHIVLDERIRRNMREVASHALLTVPALTLMLAHLEPKATHASVIRRRQAIQRTYGANNWKLARLELMREYFSRPWGKLATREDPAVMSKLLQPEPKSSIASFVTEELDASTNSIGTRRRLLNLRKSRSISTVSRNSQNGPSQN
jgi:hypothetical protein